MSKRYELQEIVSCPRCNFNQEEVADDYAYIGKRAYDEQDHHQCVDCDEWFYALRTDTYHVEIKV